MLAGHILPVDCVAFLPNGSLLVSVSSDSVCIWNTNTWAREKIDYIHGAKEAEFSNDGGLILIRDSQSWFQRQDHYIDASTLKEVKKPWWRVSVGVTTFPAPRFPVSLSDDKRSLCLKKGGQTIHFCWFPDSFEASTEVGQYKDTVCLGGRGGEVLSIDLARFKVPHI